MDEHSQKLLGSVLKQFDILEENVTCEPLLQLLEKPSGTDRRMGQ